MVILQATNLLIEVNKANNCLLKHMLISKNMSIMYNYLTRAVDSISIKSIDAGTLITANCVTTASIQHMANVQPQFTLINVCKV